MKTKRVGMARMRRQARMYSRELRLNIFTFLAWLLIFEVNLLAMPWVNASSTIAITALMDSVAGVMLMSSVVGIF